MSDFSQTYATEIAASAADCFAVVTNFPAYPEWSSPIRQCEVLEHYADGLARRVEFTLDMTIKTVRYVLEYSYAPPHSVRWHMVEGDLRAIEGSYRFEETAGRTTAHCAQSIDLGFWVPGLIRRPLEQKALHDSVEEFKKAVEAAGSGPRKTPA